MPRRGDALVLVLLGAAMLAWTWGSWPDPLFDFGRELYVPWRIVEGDVLYRDLAWFNGPLSPYVNALGFRVFGVGLRTLVFANILVGAGIAALLHGLLRAASGRLAAGVGVAVFLTVFATIQLVEVGNYNFVTPYSHEMTHGALLALLALEAMRRFSDGGSSTWALAAGTALGLLFLTKLELFVAGAGAVGLWAAMLVALPEARARALRALPGGLVAFVVPVGLAWVLLATAMPGEEALRGVLGSWVHVTDPKLNGMGFYTAGMGLDQPAANLGRMGLAAAGWAAVVLPIGLFARFAPVPEERRRIVGFVLFAGVFAALFQGLPLSAWAEVARPLPLLALGCVGYWAWRVRRAADGPARRPALAAFGLSAFAGLLLLKILLYARLHHYGFVLALPATLLLVSTVLRWLPESGRVGDAGLFRAGAGGALAAGVASVLLMASFHISGKTVDFGAGADRFRIAPRRAALVPLLEELAVRSRPGDTLAVLPEGVMLNFLLRAPHPTPFFNYMPPETVMFGEDRLLERLGASPPTRVVYAPKSTAEYGMGEFGEGYARELMDWIRESYPNAVFIGDERYGVWILERE